MPVILIYGITKDDGDYADPDEAIDEYFYIREINGELRRYCEERQGVVDKVKNRTVEAYTYRNGSIGAKCEVKVSSRGVEYLKTIPNSDPTDNLSSLPEM